MKKFLKVTIIITIFLLISMMGIILISNVYNERQYKTHYNRLNELYTNSNLKRVEFEKETLNNINNTKDKLLLAEYYDAITRYYILNNDLQKAKTYSDKTMSEYSKIKNSDKYILNAFKNLSILDICEPNSTRSLSYCNKMIDIAQNKKLIKNTTFTEKDIVGLSYAMLVVFYGESSNFDKVNECFNFLNNLDIKNIQDKEIKYIITYAKSMYNINLGDPKKAEKDMLSLSGEIDNETINLMYIKPSIYLNTSITQIINGSFEGASLGIDKAIKLNNGIKNDKLIECYIAYGFYYDRQNIFEKAKENYEKALSLSEEMSKNTDAIRSVGALIQLFEKNNKNIDDKLYYKKFWRLSTAKENSTQIHINGIIDLNNQLNKERFSIIENQRKSEIEKRKMINLILASTLVILVFLSSGIYKLHYEIKLRKKSEEKLKAIINEDYLTKAYTREYAYKNLKYIIEFKQSMYLAMLDLDNYKEVNDNFGHTVGDCVLVEFVKVCNWCITDEDFIARFGGEEFIIVLKNKTKEEAIKITENIRESLENKEWDVENLKVTVSIGLVYNKYEDVDELIKKADELLYIAKRTGKNKVEVE